MLEGVHHIDVREKVVALASPDRSDRSGERAGRVRVGIVGTNPSSPDEWSGVPWHLAQGLTSLGCDVVCVDIDLRRTTARFMRNGVPHRRRSLDPEKTPSGPGDGFVGRIQSLEMAKITTTHFRDLVWRMKTGLWRSPEVATLKRIFAQQRRSPLPQSGRRMDSARQRLWNSFQGKRCHARRYDGHTIEPPCSWNPGEEHPTLASGRGTSVRGRTGVLRSYAIGRARRSSMTTAFLPRRYTSSGSAAVSRFHPPLVPGRVRSSSSLGLAGTARTVQPYCTPSRRSRPASRCEAGHRWARLPVRPAWCLFTWASGPGPCGTRPSPPPLPMRDLLCSAIVAGAVRDRVRGSRCGRPTGDRYIGWRSR